MYRFRIFLFSSLIEPFECFLFLCITQSKPMHPPHTVHGQNVTHVAGRTQMIQRCIVVLQNNAMSRTGEPKMAKQQRVYYLIHEDWWSISHGSVRFWTCVLPSALHNDREINEYWATIPSRTIGRRTIRPTAHCLTTGLKQQHSNFCRDLLIAVIRLVQQPYIVAETVSRDWSWRTNKMSAHNGGTKRRTSPLFIFAASGG